MGVFSVVTPAPVCCIDRTGVAPPPLVDEAVDNWLDEVRAVGATTAIAAVVVTEIPLPFPPLAILLLLLAVLLEVPLSIGGGGSEN